MANCNEFTLSQIKYLIWLYRLSANGCGVKNIELANALKVSKPSVHSMLKFLSEIGMIQQETFGLAYLTEQGRQSAQKYALCYNVLTRKIMEICGEGAASENAICGLLADMPREKLDELCKNKI